MDKQIKDGIDVGQCECYSVENNSCSDTLSGSCIKEKCQTFRLLQIIKAKEQECEELKKQLERVDEDIKMKCTRCAMTNRLNEQIDQLKNELQRVDERNKTLEDLEAFRLEELATLGDLRCENNNLKQTLTEIKEIAEELKNFYEELGKCEYLTVVRLKQILQKISECEGNDEM